MFNIKIWYDFPVVIAGTHSHSRASSSSSFLWHYSHDTQMVNMKFQPLFTTLLLAMTSCSGKPNAWVMPCLQPSDSRPNQQSFKSCQARIKLENPNRNTMLHYTLQFLLFPVPTISPTFIISSISLAHTSIAFSHSHSFHLDSALSSSHFTLSPGPGYTLSHPRAPVASLVIFSLLSPVWCVQMWVRLVDCVHVFVCVCVVNLLVVKRRKLCACVTLTLNPLVNPTF